MSGRTGTSYRQLTEVPASASAAAAASAGAALTVPLLDPALDIGDPVVDPDDELSHAALPSAVPNRSSAVAITIKPAAAVDENAAHSINSRSGDDRRGGRRDPFDSVNSTSGGRSVPVKSKPKPKAGGAAALDSLRSTASQWTTTTASGHKFRNRIPKPVPLSRCSKVSLCLCFTILLSAFIAIFTACVLRSIARHNLENIVTLLETNSFNKTVSGTGVVTYTLQVSRDEAERYDIHSVEQTLLGTIYVRLCQRDITLMRQVLCGANIVVQRDRAFYYKLFSTLREAYHRISSHTSLVPQYGVPEGHVLKTLLTGERPDSFDEIKGTGDTWFQFEGAEWNPWHNPSDSFVHLLNYFQYKLTNRNIGPLGSSPHTDKNPIIIPFPNPPNPGPNPNPTPPPTPPVALELVAAAGPAGVGSPLAPATVHHHPNARIHGGMKNKSLHKSRFVGFLTPFRLVG